jgi:hypothetical protein
LAADVSAGKARQMGSAYAQNDAQSRDLLAPECGPYSAIGALSQCGSARPRSPSVTAMVAPGSLPVAANRSRPDSEDLVLCRVTLPARPQGHRRPRSSRRHRVICEPGAASEPDHHTASDEAAAVSVGIGRRCWASLALTWASLASVGTSSGPTLGPARGAHRSRPTDFACACDQPANRRHRTPARPVLRRR